MKVLYLDESGDHGLRKIDPQYSIFVLGGLIVEESYSQAVMEPRLKAFKLDLFGDENLIRAGRTRSIYDKPGCLSGTVLL